MVKIEVVLHVPMIAIRVIQIKLVLAAVLMISEHYHFL